MKSAIVLPCIDAILIPINAPVLIPVNAPALINAPCIFSENNVILTCMNSCLVLWMRQLETGSTLKGKNLLLEEQILSFKS